MIAVRRLLGVAAFLAVAALLTSSDVWGEPGAKELKNWRKLDDGKNKPALKADAFAEEAERNRFEGVPLSIYQDKEDRYFALQIQPKLPEKDDRPIDYLVMVDSSASKAFGSLAIAHELACALADGLGADDRMALWTANVQPRDLSRGFKAGKELKDSLLELSRELPLGAVDLKKSIDKALASFEVKASRRRILLYVGDGRSVAQPVDTDTRAGLCESLVKKQVAFFAIPLGENLDAQTLHGMIGCTGGRAVRLGTREKPAELVVRLKVAAAGSILYNPEIKLPEGATEVLPSQLPPLRGDSATLMVGKLAKDVKSVDFALNGEVAGKEFSVKTSHKVPAGDNENHFLVGVHGQWKGAKTRPALLPAERALAFAHKQNQLAVEDLVAKADMAMEAEKLEIARKIYEQAQELDPHNPQAKGGLVLVEKMKNGKNGKKMTREDMLKELRLDAAKREVMRVEKGKRKIVVLAEEDEKLLDKGEAPPRAPAEDLALRRRIAEQQVTAMVNEAIRQATRIVRTNPAEASAILAQTRADVEGSELPIESKRALQVRLTNTMQTVQRVGAVVERDQSQALALRAAADARLDLRRAADAANDRIRARMRVFGNLMAQAREEEAYRQAEALRLDLTAQGLPIPPAVTAASQIALSGYHLRELRELRHVRQERWLATMLEVERSHVPFPDEPPVEYPSAATIRKITRGRYDNWRDFSKDRIAKYSIATFGSDVPGRMFELRDRLNKTIDFKGNDDPKLTLIEFLNFLSERYDVSFDVNEKAFRFEMLNDVLKTELTKDNPLPPMNKTTLATVLKKALQRVPVPSGATYLIRRDQIEITTGQVAAAEKVVRVYPVADLVTPIPNAFNQQAVGQTATILGSLGQLGLAGGLGAGGLNLGAALGGIGGIGGLAGIGGIGGLAGLGGGLAGLGGGLAGLGGGLAGLGGGLAGLGGGLAGLGGGLAGIGGIGGLAGAGGAALGNALGLGGQFQGQQNLGVGGGFAGFTGGQLGQLGNLGGQFGLQGGNQSQLLITLIRQVVGRPKDWAVQYNPVTGLPLDPLDDEKGDAGSIAQDNNNLGYYPPALALVVKAPSIIHTREFNLPLTGAGMAAPAGGEVALDDKGRKINVAPDAQERDPKKIWEAALVKGVNDPGLIIATTDFLAMNRQFVHVAEFLKANLRQGIVVKPWVYKSLAIALRESGGSAEEIERAEISAADLSPMDAMGYLSAARSLAEDKNYERALAFCKQAADLTPGVAQPYADAARYAEMAGDAKSLQWSAGKLLSQEWPSRNAELQQTALQKVESLSRRLDKSEADKLKKAIEASKRRDLVVKLVWQGEADLDLKVQEPTGSVASPLARQTINGGTLIASGPSSPNGESYVAAKGFSGEYKITVEKVWGKPLGNKAQLKIIRHQGTKDESEQLVTIKIVSNVSTPITVKLENGRRSETAYVPPAGAQEALQEPRPSVELSQSTDAVLAKLRQAADPEVTGVTLAPQGGAYGAGYSPSRRQAAPKSSEKDRTLYQTKVSNFVQNSVEVTAQAVLSADRRSVRLSLNPVYNTAQTTGPVRVVNPVFPGGAAKAD
jgi:tetratricopeptide (TPR) repeat protein